MRLKSISSGSGGNCILIGDKYTNILCDVGINKKNTLAALAEEGLSLDDINGIVITHEHGDHIGGLGVILRAKGIPVYSTAGTIREIFNKKSLGKMDESLFTPIKPEEPFTIGSISVTAHSTSHDVVDSVCYSFSSYNGEKKISVATDLGIYNDYLVNAVKGSDLMLIEANHDVHMLEVGPYDYMLKQRILSKWGHLSNENCGKLISESATDKLKGVILGHLSKENNMPCLALETVRLELMANEIINNNKEFFIDVALENVPTKMYKI